MWMSRKRVEDAELRRELQAIAQAKPCNACGELKLPSHECPPVLHVDDMQKLKGRLSVRCPEKRWTYVPQKNISRQGVATWHCSRCKCKHKARVFVAAPLKPDTRTVLDRGGRPTSEGDTFGT